MYTTKLKNDESFEKMLKRFHKKCLKGDLQTDINKHKRFTKKSEIKRKRKRLEKFAIKTGNFKILKTKIY